MLALLAAALAAPPVGAGAFLAPDPRGASAPDRTFDMRALHLDLALDPAAGTVAGTATWTVDRLADGPLVLDQVALTIEEVRVADRPVPWHVDGNTLVVEVPGESAEVAVRYRATPRDGLHFRRPGAADAYGEVWSQGEGEDNRHWFPGWDHPNDRFVYRGTITAPPGWKVLTNSGMDLVNYLVMVAAAPYEVHGDETIAAWVPPGTSPEGVRRVLDPIPAMMAHFARRTGVPYPWGPYRQVFVQRFLYTGMENTSATVQDRWMVGDARIGGTRGRRIANVVAHELAHQWYGDLLTCRDWRELWLNEGFATYLAADWQATVEGPDGWAVGVRRRYEASLATEALARRFHAGPDAPDSRNVYNKGASVLQMLRVMLGERAFWRGVAHYTRANQLALVDTEDLRDAMERASGLELGWFFQQWVELPYVPALTVSSTYEDGTLTVTVRQDTSEAPAYALPVEVEIPTPEAHLVKRVWLTGPSVDLRVPVAARPAYVAFDPRGGLLAKVTHTQDPDAWEAQLASPSPYARVVAADALAETDRTGALAAIAGDDTASFALRSTAVRALGEQRATAALLPLVETRDDQLRQEVVEALGKGVGKAAAPALVARVERDAAPDVVAAALGALARLDGPTALKLARTRLRGTGVEEVGRIAAAAAVLGEHGTPAD
ncbi:MAG: M1 family aminopeptidase, partial [Myxococcota bacterium]